MKYFRIILLAVGVLFGANGLAGAAGEVTFMVTDIPGHWFDNNGSSLAIVDSVPGGTTIHFKQKNDDGTYVAESRHTVTSLLWPSDAKPSELIDQKEANQENHSVTLTTPGLYVFVCKLHPYMLGGVIVDDTRTTTLKGGVTVPAYDIGNQLTLLVSKEVTDTNLTFNSNSNLGLRLLRAFFIVTTPSNWKDYTKVGQPYKPVYPPVPVVVTNGEVVKDLNEALQGAFDGDLIPSQQKIPTTKGVGEVWVDTQFELTAEKGPSFPGTMSVVSGQSWNVKRKIALPNEKMNNGHNLWPSHDQKQMYQTEWHGTSLFVLDRLTGGLLQEIKDQEWHDVAHVMTRVDTQQVHVGLNGGDGVVEMNRLANGKLEFNRLISMQDPNNPTKQTQPHAHWMGFDGKHMVTPNSNSADSTLYEFTGRNWGKVLSKEDTGAVSIATGMMPDSSKYYVSNYLGHSISVMNGPEKKKWGKKWYAPGQKIKDISLIEGYDPVDGCKGGKCVDGLIGGLPVQTPVSPDGKFVIIGNTLGGTIAIIRTSDDTLVKLIPCDPGCHGVNFGAKKGGGYYAYVTSKFANRMIVLDYDKDNNGVVDPVSDPTDLIAGWVVLANNNLDHRHRDDMITENYGQGGQGVMPIPNVYNGWVQKLPPTWKLQLTKAQRNPISQNRHDKDEDKDHDNGKGKDKDR